MKGRTILEFPCPADFWSQVDAWAAATGFALHGTEGNRRLYRKRFWLLMAPAWVEIRQDGRRAILEAWIKSDFFLILNILSGSKPETAIKSGGLTAAVPRKRAREAVNLLLTRFGQPPVA
jgi:hypothetical protein